jgi:hypothetical protein
MAEHTAFAYEQKRRKVLALAAQVPVTDGVDASVDRVEAPGADPPLDRPRRESDSKQLQTTDDPVLPLGNDRDRGIPFARFTFATYTVVKVKLAGHGREHARACVAALLVLLRHGASRRL